MGKIADAKLPWTLTIVQITAEDVREAEHVFLRARTVRNAWIREARERGASYRELANAAQLDHAGVWRIINRIKETERG